ncbi:MAG: hypothetical protein Q9168_005210 [Polycauliona sp. 1 TL-2023]
MAPILSLGVSLFLLLQQGLASPVAASSVNPRTCSTCTNSYSVDFNDIPAPPLGLENPLNVPPTPYNNLKYTGLVVQSMPAVSALKFASPPNNAIVDTAQTLLGNKPAISKDYPGSQVEDFSFKSFFFGWYKKDPKIAEGADIVTNLDLDIIVSVAVPQLLNVPEKQCVLNSNFNNLHTAKLQVIDAPIADKLTVLYTDIYKYITRGKCCK